MVSEHRSLQEDHRPLRKNPELAADHANMADKVTIEFNKECKGAPPDQAGYQAPLLLLNLCAFSLFLIASLRFRFSFTEGFS
jgi:hypothetical protein